MDVRRQTDLQGERISDRQSHSSNYRYCSQSRKISVGVLVDSISKAKTNDLQEPRAAIAETGTSSKMNCAKECERHTPLAKKQVIVEPKDASPWVSTRSFNPNISASVAVQDKERTPSFPATRKTRPRAKLLEKASAAHNLKFFAAKSCLGSDICRQMNFDQDMCSMEGGKADNAEHVENQVCPTEQGVQLEKERVQGKDRTAETGGHATLKMKLMEILGNGSSPNKHHPNLQCTGRHLNPGMNGNQSPIEKISPNSDTIENDSPTHIFARPITRSLSRNKASTKRQKKSSEATKSINRKVCREKRIFTFKGDQSGGLRDNFNDGSLPCERKRKRITEMSRRVEPKNVEERQQSEKTRLIPAVEKLKVHTHKVSNASCSSDRRKDILVEPKEDAENNTSFEYPLNAMTDQRDALKKNQQDDISVSLLKNKRNYVHNPSTTPSQIKSHGINRKKVLGMSSVMETLQAVKPKTVEESQQSEKSRSIPAVEKLTVNKNDVSNASCFSDRRKDMLVEPKGGAENNMSSESPLNATTDQRDEQQSMEKASKKNQQKKRNIVQDPLTPTSGIKSHGSLLKSKQEELNSQSPADTIFNKTSIRRFKGFLSPKSAECEPHMHREPSVGRYKQNNSPTSRLVKPSNIMGEDDDNLMYKSSTDFTDSQSSEDETHKDGRESEELSPEIHISETNLHNSIKSIGNDKDGVNGPSPASGSLKVVQDTNELETFLEENHEDDLTRVVTLLTMSLNKVQTKLKSLSSRRSADILCTAVEDIFLQLQNAESLIKTDVGKLTNLSHSKGKQLETRFQEKQEQLLGIHKRFKAEVEQHLHDCGSLIEGLEEHQNELKRTVEKKRAEHKKFLSQLEQEINAKVDDAGSRIMAVEKMAREKILQLKIGVAECLKHGLS